MAEPTFFTPHQRATVEAAMARIMSSVTLRRCGWSARALEWLAITGAVDVCRMSQAV